MRGKINTYQSTFRVPIIGVDIMGGDTSPEVLLEAIISFSQELKEKARFVIFATPEIISSQKNISSRIQFISAKEVVSPDDDALIAIRRKTDSSIYVGMRMLQKHKLTAFVSTGNTGALIGCAIMCLPTLQGIARPALLTLLPTKLKEVAVLDVGANLRSKVDHLVNSLQWVWPIKKLEALCNPLSVC